MTTSVIHQPRVAWDLARTTLALAAAGHDEYRWFAAQVERWLGRRARDEFGETRWRLIAAERADVHAVELGRWRVRLEDAMSRDPSLGASLAELRLDAQARLSTSDWTL